MSTDDGGEACVCEDGAHGVYMDGKGHSRRHLTVGRGALMNVSKKLGFIATSSTKTEVVADGEHFHKCGWCRYFHVAQEDKAKEHTSMQDNES